MKIDFSQELKGIDGVVLVEGNKSTPLTLATVSVTALLASFPDEQQLAGPDKAKRFNLALALVKEGVHELTAEQVSLVKLVLGKAYGPLVVGRAYNLLEGVKEE